MEVSAQEIFSIFNSSFPTQVFANVFLWLFLFFLAFWGPGDDIKIRPQ